MDTVRASREPAVQGEVLYVHRSLLDDAVEEERDLSLPPHSAQAEEAVLGSILKHPASIQRVQDFLKPDAFYTPRCRAIFRAMLSLAADDVPIDHHTIADRLQQHGTYESAGGVLYLTEINLATPTAAFVEYYGRIVERTAVMRHLISRAQTVAELAYRDNLEPHLAIQRAQSAFADLSYPQRPLQIGSARFAGLSLAELRKRPAPSYIIEDYAQADSLAVLEGVDGSYKTFLALAMAHSVALGREWVGRHVVQGRVLYLLGEGARGLPRRADAWQIVNLGGREDVPDLVFVVDEMPQLWKGDAAAVIAANPGPFVFVIVDTLARSLVGGNENLQQDMGLLVDGCDELRRAYAGPCVLLLHHLNATGGTRGSTTLPGAISTKLRLDRPAGSRTVSLSVKKQRDDETAPPLQLVARTVELGTVDDRGRPETSLVLEAEKRAETGGPTDGQSGPVFGPVLTPGELAALEALSALLSALPNATFATWRDAAKLPKSTFKDARLNLIRRDLVIQTPDGRYVLSPRGEEEGRRGPKQGRLDMFRPSANGEGRRGTESPIRTPSFGPQARPSLDELSDAFGGFRLMSATGSGVER
jgi:hypothetical protein